MQSSTYAKLAGVPVAVIGLAGYALILASLRLRGELGYAMTCCIALIGFGFSAYLTYRELFTIHAVCQWCVASAVVATLLAILALARWLSADLTPVSAETPAEPNGAPAGREEPEPAAR